MEECVYNPYDFINPVKDPKHFAGRKKELAEIEYYLKLSKSDKPKYFHMALVGPRSAGKKSLLNMIEYKANELGLLAVKIPLNGEIVKSDVLFFKEIIDGILTKGAEKGMYRKIYRRFRRIFDMLDTSVEIPLLFGTAYVGFKKEKNVDNIPQHVLIHDLRELRAEANKKKIPTIVLLFDECDLLSQNEVLLQKLRNVFMEIEGYILVFSGTEKMFPAISNVFSPIPRFFKRINVENFKDIRETEECLLKPLNEKEKEAFDRACVADIHQLTNGSPYEINLVAHYMYRRWKEGKNPKIQLSPEVLDDVLNELEILRKEGYHKIANKIKHYWIDQLKILKSILEFPKVPRDWLAEYMLLDEINTIQPKDVYVRKSIIKDHIEHLKRDEIIAEEGRKLVFKGDLFDILYLKYLCASKGIIDVKEFFMGLPDDPLLNLYYKLTRTVLLKDFRGCYIHTKFDTVEKIDNKIRRKVVFEAFNVTIPPGEHVILEISPEKADKEFYTGVQNSIRFRINVEWMKEGFVIQIKFQDKEDLKRFKNRLNALKDKLEFLGYKLILKDEISWNNEGIDFLKRGEISKAIECFDKAIEINSTFELAWANKASAFFELKRYDEALKCVNKALDLNPSWADVLKLKGMILINQGKNEEALECLDKALKLNPEDWSIWDNKGRALFNLKRFDEAIACFEKSLKLKPDNHEVLYLKGASLANIGKYEDAIDSLNKALEINPDFIPALMVKGEILLNKGDYNDTLSCLNKILEKEKTNIKALILKGITLSRLNRYEEARKCCDEVIKIEPNNALAWYNKACFKVKLGDVENTLKCLEKAIEIDEKLREIAKIDESFINLRSDEKFQNLIEKSS